MASGLRCADKGVITEKPEPFKAENGTSYYKLKVGFMGGYAALKATKEQYDSVTVGMEVEFAGKVFTEGGKTAVTLELIGPPGTLAKLARPGA